MRNLFGMGKHLQGDTAAQMRAEKEEEKVAKKKVLRIIAVVYLPNIHILPKETT